MHAFKNFMQLAVERVVKNLEKIFVLITLVTVFNICHSIRLNKKDVSKVERVSIDAKDLFSGVKKLLARVK